MYFIHYFPAVLRKPIKTPLCLKPQWKNGRIKAYNKV